MAAGSRPSSYSSTAFDPGTGLSVGLNGAPTPGNPGARAPTLALTRVRSGRLSPMRDSFGEDCWWRRFPSAWDMEWDRVARDFERRIAAQFGTADRDILSRIAELERRVDELRNAPKPLPVQMKELLIVAYSRLREAEDQLRSLERARGNSGPFAARGLRATLSEVAGEAVQFRERLLSNGTVSPAFLTFLKAGSASPTSDGAEELAQDGRRLWRWIENRIATGARFRVYFWSLLHLSGAPRSVAYVDDCWKDQLPVDSRLNPKCGACRWAVCACGACEQGRTRHESSDWLERTLPRDWILCAAGAP